MLTVYLTIGVVLAIQTALTLWSDSFNKAVVEKYKVAPTHDLTKALICFSYVVIWPAHLVFASMVTKND